MEFIRFFLALVALSSIIAIVWPRPFGFVGIEKRSHALIIFVLSFFFFGALIPEKDESVNDAAQASVSASTAEKSSPILTRKQELDNLKIANFRWGKGGFGTIMKVNFEIVNKNSFDVKDVIVSCTGYSNSGTAIDSNMKTIYEIARKGNYIFVKDFTMGFIRSQATQSSCEVLGFTKI